ncbi:MAG: hypothetical protein QXJ14_02695 [Candidatus Aenigmatarchaeota archaeon]
MEYEIKKYEEEIKTTEEEEQKDWELDIKDILMYFNNIIKGYYYTLDDEGNLVLKKGEMLANDKFIQILNYKLLTFNKFTVLSHTEKNIIKKLVYYDSILFSEEIIFNKEKYNIKNLEEALNLIMSVALYEYHAGMKSVEGGERIYRGKIVERREIIKPKQQQFKIPFMTEK